MDVILADAIAFAKSPAPLPLVVYCGALVCVFESKFPS